MADEQTLEAVKYKPEQPHELGKLLEKWWLAHGFDETSEQWQAFLEVFHEKYLKEKVEEIAIKHDNMGKLGASAAGSCKKKQYFKKALATKGIRMRHQGSDYWTFLHGHILEAAVLAVLELLPDVEIVQTQYVIQDDLTYTTADALIIYKGKRHLLSIKTASYKGSFWSKGSPNLRGFAALVDKGIYWENKHAYCQSQLEMAISGVHDTIIITAAKDYIKAMASVESIIRNSSMAFYAEHVPYRREHADKIAGARGWIDGYAKDCVTYEEDDYKNGAEEWSPSLERYVKIHDWNKTTFKRRKHPSLPYNPCYYCEIAPQCWGLISTRRFYKLKLQNKEEFAEDWKRRQENYEITFK